MYLRASSRVSTEVLALKPPTEVTEKSMMLISSVSTLESSVNGETDGAAIEDTNTTHSNGLTKRNHDSPKYSIAHELISSVRLHKGSTVLMYVPLV